MSSLTSRNVPAAMQPKPDDYGFDLDHVLSSVVGIRTIVPEDAFTAEVLGTERAGNGVVIREDGLVLTIGYLITEAESVWLHLIDGRVVPGHVVGFDQESGLGLVQALGRLELPALPLGDSAAARRGESVVVGGAGGRQHAVAAQIVAKQQFAGYWEYVLEEALFTTPAHPHWGGAALIGQDGELLGIGSLQLEGVTSDGEGEHLNMIVPIDLLKPILADMLTIGRPDRPARPWLGLYATELEDRIVIAGVATNGPAHEAGLREGDIVLAVGDEQPEDLADFFRAIWALGEAGIQVPLQIQRDGQVYDTRVTSGDRNRFLKAPQLH